MKLGTHNILMCNKKTCANSEENYPLIIKANKVNNPQVEFNEEKVKLFFEKMNKKTLTQACKDLNLFKFDFEKLTDELKESKEFWEYVSHILFEVEVDDGNLVCAKCGREYQIKRGIVDMVLKDDEI